MSLFGRISEETPKYNIIKSFNSVQVRKYFPQIRIRSKFHQDNPSVGFRPLARYIFGGNEESKYISMTAPVLQENKTMDFVMPSSLTLDQMPKPNDTNVEIVQVPEQEFLVITFNGNPRSQELIQAKLQELSVIASQESIKVEISNYILAIYNPPWTFHYFRKNEILVPLVA